PGHSLRRGAGTKAGCGAPERRGLPVHRRQGGHHAGRRGPGRGAHRLRQGPGDAGEAHRRQQSPRGGSGMTILDQLAAHARERVAADQAENSLDVLQAQCRAIGRGRGARFRSALETPELSFICEVKKASPSKGVIAKNFPYLDIARDYERAGADAISCLTEPKWFLGSDQIFREIRGAVDTPMLRKDFTVDPYQLYQARLMGADCVLLICALMDTKTLERYLTICHDLGLAALVEAHDEKEIASAVSAGAEIIGVNNRNLKDFSVNLD